MSDFFRFLLIGGPNKPSSSSLMPMLVMDAKAIIGEITDQPTEYKDEPGTVLSNDVDRVQVECSITRQEAYKAIDLLEAKGVITRGTTGIIQLAGESQ